PRAKPDLPSQELRHARSRAAALLCFVELRSPICARTRRSDLPARSAISMESCANGLNVRFSSVQIPTRLYAMGSSYRPAVSHKKNNVPVRRSASPANHKEPTMKNWPRRSFSIATLGGAMAVVSSAYAKHQHHNGQQLLADKINTNGKH